MRRAVLVGARHLTYLEAGAADGRVLVLLHAFPLTADMWQEQLDDPPEGWRILAADFAGLGGSDDHTRESVALDDYAADVLAWLDRLGIERFVLAGLSMGGYVALAIARIAPQRLSGLVLADTKAAADSPEARAGRGRMLDVLSERGAHGVADEMIPKLLGNTTREMRPELVARVRSLVMSNDPEGLRRAILRLRDRRDAAPTLASIRVPALVVVGEEDVVTPVTDAQSLQGALPMASLETIPRAGHLTNLESPLAFNAALWKFLSTL